MGFKVPWIWDEDDVYTTKIAALSFPSRIFNRVH